jgi:hypothetical protein
MLDKRSCVGRRRVHARLKRVPGGGGRGGRPSRAGACLDRRAGLPDRRCVLYSAPSDIGSLVCPRRAQEVTVAVCAIRARLPPRAATTSPAASAQWASQTHSASRVSVAPPRCAVLSRVSRGGAGPGPATCSGVPPSAPPVSDPALGSAIAIPLVVILAIVVVAFLLYRRSRVGWDQHKLADDIRARVGLSLGPLSADNKDGALFVTVVENVAAEISARGRSVDRDRLAHAVRHCLGTWVWHAPRCGSLSSKLVLKPGAGELLLKKQRLVLSRADGDDLEDDDGEQAFSPPGSPQHSQLALVHAHGRNSSMGDEDFKLQRMAGDVDGL